MPGKVKGLLNARFEFDHPRGNVVVAWDFGRDHVKVTMGERLAVFQLVSGNKRPSVPSAKNTMQAALDAWKSEGTL